MQQAPIAENAGMQMHFPQVTNPLEWDVILSHVFSFCSVDTLKECRKVSKFWWNTSLSTWRQKAVLRVFGDQETGGYNNKGIMLSLLLRYLNEFSPENPHRAGQKDHYQLNNCPFKQYELVHFRTPSRETEFRSFWEKCGPHLEHVTFNNSTVFYGNELWSLFNSLPNLNSLCILDCILDVREAGFSPHRGFTGTLTQIRELRTQLQNMTQCPGIKTLRIRSTDACGQICKVLKRFPNLEVMIMSERSPIINDRIRHRRWIIPARDFFRTMWVEMHRDDHRLRSLKKLDIIDFWEDAVRDFHINVNYEEFSRFEFSLTHLSIDFGENSTQRALATTLKKQAKTLQVLKVFRAPTYGPYIHSFPWSVQLPHLRELYLWGYIVHNFGFLLFMPKLRVLQINISCSDMEYKLNYLLRKRFLLMWSEDFAANTVDMLQHKEMDKEPVCPNLETLFVDYNFPPSSWIHLRNWFPNLRSLSSIVNPDTVTLVGKLWPKLTKLELLFGSDIGRYEDGIISTLSILTNLKDFMLETYCCQSILTDMTFYQGILPFDYLERVDICVSKGFSKRAEIDLKEKYGVNRASVVRNYGEHEEKCCTRAEYNCKCIPLDPPKEEPRTTRSGRIRNPERI